MWVPIPSQAHGSYVARMWLVYGLYMAWGGLEAPSSRDIFANMRVPARFRGFGHEIGALDRQLRLFLNIFIYGVDSIPLNV